MEKLEKYNKLFKEQKPGNCKNICIYFDKGLQQFKNLKKEKQKFFTDKTKTKVYRENK